ncbi:MAG: type II toxin-antitoxin system Phd/YefM family antitoxin [Flavobacteriales bacterium]|nr:type II toxin-antitoxin system Phd/YefM family antitoxin [Flavobacteriales bacterium]
MLTTTLSDFRKDTKKYFNDITSNNETLLINRGKDSGVVMMSLDEFNSLTSSQERISDEYKLMMDGLLEKRAKNEINFIDHKDFLEGIKR